MHSCTTSALRRGFRRRLGTGGGAALCAPFLCVLALAACSSVPDEINPVSWYDAVAGDEDVAEAEPAPGTEEEFPTLSSVPDEPAQTQSTDEYAAVAEGLEADKANAQYTNESIRRADDEVEGTTPIVAAAPEPEPQVVQPEPEPEFEPEPEPVAAAEPVVAPEPVVVAETQAAAAVPAQTAQSAQADDYSQYATVAEGLRAHSGSAPLPATSPIAAASTTTTTTAATTVAATTSAATTSAASTTAATTTVAATTTAQVQPVEQAVEPVPAQPLQPVQQTAVVAEPVPAQPLPGTTVAATATTAQVSVPAATTATATTMGTTAAAAAQPAAAQGSFMDMFNAAYQASAARTLSGATAATTTATAVPAVAQPTAATALPASYAPTARYHGARPTRLIASVMFADGSARLDAQARKTLLEVAYAYGATGGQILLVGHASGSGGSNAELANFDVSLKRAVAVANELMRLQVTPENILVEAVGDNMPQVSLDMAGGAVNRRVDIYLGN